ncbi:alpha-actinin-3b [Tachysurus ichikawai]
MTAVETQVQYNTTYTVTTNEYMIQEEDWDRDLLLDPAWEKQQRKGEKDLIGENVAQISVLKVSRAAISAERRLLTPSPTI